MTLSVGEIKGSIPCGLERTSKMKVYINNSLHSTTGYELVIKDDDGLIIETKTIDTLVDDGKTLKLPENPSNRKYFNLKKVEDADGYIELTYKESIKLGTVTRKGWMEFLTDEERENLEEAERALEEMKTEYKRNAEARREESKAKPMTEKEKLQARIARLQAKIEKMESEEA